MMNTVAALAGSLSAPRLLDQVRGKIRLKHYSLRTEQAYLGWIKRFIRHHGKRHPLSNGHWSVWVNGNWRITFAFEGADAILVDYQDYH